MRHFHRTMVHELEGGVGHVLVHQLLQHLAGLRPRDGEADEAHVIAVDMDRAVLRQMLLEPAHVILLRLGRTPHVEAVIRRLGDGEVADQLAGGVQHRRQDEAARLRHLVGHHARQEGFSTRAREAVLGEIGDLGDAHAVARGQHLRLHMLEVVGAAEGHDILGLDTLGREPQRGFEAPAIAHHGTLRDHRVIECGGLLRACRGQFLVGEADREAAGIVLAHLLVGVGAGRPFSEAGAVHGPDVEARVAVHHPLRQCEAHAATLAEARHDAAGEPEVLHALHRADDRVAVRREGEGPVDHALDAGLCECGEVLVAKLEVRRDPVEVGLQQLAAEGPWRVLGAPRHAGALIGAEHHAGTFLAHVDL